MAVKQNTVYMRIKRGWSPERAVSEPLCQPGAIYKIYENRKCVAKIRGASKTAQWLSRETRFTVTKNMIIGRLFRHPERPMTIGEYTIERVMNEK